MVPRQQNARSARALESRRSGGIPSYRCQDCRGIHPLRKCARFLKLSAEKRLRAALINKYCANCLAHERRSSPPRRPESTTPGPSLSSLLQRHSVNILPTALVKLETGTKTFETAALIDPCTPMSCIDASLASAFTLPMTNVGDEKVCTTTIRSRIDANTKLEVVLKIVPSVRIRTPVRALSDTVVSKFRDIMLADDQFHRPATVSMVLGADVYPKVIQSGFLTFDEGMPVAQKTVFGWIVSGACSLP
ncbi:uncharacterized protein LOC26535268 isoform X3 [Drosophila yakuba]|uniref:uncharacterized protein LOC26535268 isoform X3 n=1 Tax=Drosophila yakuba TaxID=7245 RepID=UPI0019307446|nr:uncharacterized protein LOC26535268 isoform X3 [Drosophila yakuba]